jgi:serine/threonine-protein kinase
LSGVPRAEQAFLSALIGARVDDHYRLVRLLGAGGMGAVFEAISEQTRHRAAVKVLFPEYGAQDRWVDRLFKEALAVNLVEHPGLVRIFRCGHLDTQHGRTGYILMEFLSGEPLFSRAHRLWRAGERFPLPAALQIGRQVADALCAVHDKGIVHRDLKPENIFLHRDPEVPGGERVKVLDFGVAKFQEPGMVLHPTTGDHVVGTPIYMSPEQCRGVPLTGKSDVYALGVVLYELLGGKPPFEHEEAGTLLSMHIRDEVPPLRDLRPDLSQEVTDLIAAMLRKDPQDRPTMIDVAVAIEVLTDASATPTSPGAPPPPSGRSADRAATVGVTAAIQRGRPAGKRRRILLGSALAAVLLLGAGLGLRARTAPDQKPPAPLTAAPPVQAPPVQQPQAKPETLPETTPATAPETTLAEAETAQDVSQAAPPGRSRRRAAGARRIGTAGAKAAQDCPADERRPAEIPAAALRRVPLPEVRELSKAAPP